ncbi:hypothetical protein [Bacillus sp. JCM 19041]|uniref:hypothetical protein n=1 Tax=Bacillus sp. JCM 19041 TaxID=1460637 RepID=UPI0006CFF208
MFKANVKKLVVRTSVVMGLATTATIATSQTADANVDMNKVDAAEKKQAQTETTSEQAESNTNQTITTVSMVTETKQLVKFKDSLGFLKTIFSVLKQNNLYVNSKKITIYKLTVLPDLQRKKH